MTPRYLAQASPLLERLALLLAGDSEADTKIETLTNDFARRAEGLDQIEFEELLIWLKDKVDTIGDQYRTELIDRLSKAWGLSQSRIHQWTHKQVRNDAWVDIPALNGEPPLRLIVTHAFYQRRLRTLKVRTLGGDVLTSDGYRLSNIVAAEFEQPFHSILLRKTTPGLLDLRPSNLIARRTEEQRVSAAAQQEQAREQQQQAALGELFKEKWTERGGEQCDPEAEYALRIDLLNTFSGFNKENKELLSRKGGVRIVEGHLMPFDDHKVPLLQIAGKIVHQAFDADNFVSGENELFTKPARPSGSNSNCDQDIIEYAQQAVENPRRTQTGAECKPIFHKDGQGMPDRQSKRDGKTIEIDVQTLPEIRINPKAKVRRRKLEGANGLTRKPEDFVRSVPPYAELWDEGQEQGEANA